MAQPIVPHVPQPRRRSRWSLPVTILGAAGMIAVARLYDGRAGLAFFMVAIIVSMVLDELAAKRGG